VPDKRNRLKMTRQRDCLPSPARRLRLYTDEDIPSRAVAMLRAGGANVLTTAEAGNNGKDDTAQVAFAARKGRVLITRNAKHLLDERIVPPESTPGVIALDVSDHHEDSYLATTAMITEFLVPYAEHYEAMNIRVSTAGCRFRFVTSAGARETVSLSLDELFEGRHPTDGLAQSLAGA
jgi:predicted nuclease of predicted toxin-antitoxin system